MINKKIGLTALLAGFVASEIMAGTVANYVTGDVLLCFRNGQTKDLVVDVGQYTALSSGTPNQRIPITQYSISQINFAFGSVDNLNWSAFSWLGDNTLLVSRKRTDPNVQSLTPSAANNGLQEVAAQNMGAVPAGGSYQFINGPYIANSTAASVVEPEGANSYPSQQGRSYKNALFGTGSFPNFGGTLPSGDPENVTAVDFDSSGTVVRSDFYQIPPGSGTAGVTYLGYFEFAPDGTMTFVAKPIAVPVIKSISRNGNDSVIAFTSGLYGTYTLRGTNTLTSGTSLTNWPVIATLTSGDTSIHTVTNTTTDNIRFYTITAQ
jgi:hypothetical protein